MLKVQELLKTFKSVDGGLSILKEKYGILSKRHDTDTRVILDYDQIKADKKCPVVRECRGLVLDTNDWTLVARGFSRFFNAGECLDIDKKFHWDNEVIATHKEDGSFALLYFYNGEWRMNTRFSFAEHKISDFPITWFDLFKIAYNFDEQVLNKEYTYVFELCSRYNKVVRDYQTPKVYLLTVFHGEIELTYYASLDEANRIGVEMPEANPFDNIADVQMYIVKLAEEDKTFEGVVLRDCHNNRIKVKSDYYVALHRLNNNGNLANARNIIPLIMNGEIEEILIYFPELKERVGEIDRCIRSIKKEIDNVWFCHHDEPSQKKFAIAVCKDTKYTAPLFSARKLGGHPFDYITPEYLERYIV